MSSPPAEPPRRSSPRNRSPQYPVRRVTVTVPASSANLGPGFDSFGLALELRDRVVAEPLSGGPTELVVRGQGADQVADPEHNLILAALRAAADRFGVTVGPLSVRCENAIPHGRGLGSSAAAIVSGVLLARALGGGPDIGDEDVLAVASAIEGHPDNVAAALLGGFTLARVDPDGRPTATRLAVHPDVRAVLFVAGQSCATSTARAALPAQVPHADAAANAAAAGLLVHALTADPSLLFPATRDRLHQDARAATMPQAAELLGQLRTAGIAAVLSGAGPSVLALADAPITIPDGIGAGFDARPVRVGGPGAAVEIETG